MGVFALMTMVMAVVPLIMAVGYVVAPTERKRVPGALITRSVLRVYVRRSIRAAGWRSSGPSPGPRPESACLARHGRRAVPNRSLQLVGFGCLTVAWLLVALGKRGSA